MSKDDFVRICALCGYASKKVATAYAAQRVELTESDFIDVFSINERIIDARNHHTLGEDRFHYVEGAKTTKRFWFEDC